MNFFITKNQTKPNQTNKQNKNTPTPHTCTVNTHAPGIELIMIGVYLTYKKPRQALMNDFMLCIKTNYKS